MVTPSGTAGSEIALLSWGMEVPRYLDADSKIPSSYFGKILTGWQKSPRP
jgi:hypothetical protein